MYDFSAEDVCKRIRQVRIELHGPRGKSAFAKRLDLSPSTYDYYESDRVPPVEVLLRIAEQTGVDLRWLLTGQEPEQGPRQPVTHHPVLQRAASRLADTPGAARALAAFLDLYEAAQQLDSSCKQTPQEDSPGPCKKEPSGMAAPRENAYRAGWIPILGRTAAGMVAFWGQDEDVEGLTRLDSLIEASTRAAPKQIDQAFIRTPPADPLGKLDVQIVTLPAGGDLASTSQFLVCPDCKQKHPDAFALRVDGDSMAPEIPHGQLVLLSPSCPAVDAEPAVVQLKNQIGVTCKIYRQTVGEVHLIPINERYEPTTYPVGDVAWALRVLARVVTR